MTGSKYSICVVPPEEDVDAWIEFYEQQGYENIKKHTAFYIPGTELVGELPDVTGGVDTQM